MRPDLRLELRRKAIQALGLAFVPFGTRGAAALAVLLAMELAHLGAVSRGGLPGWRGLRRIGERPGGSPHRLDPGPLMLAAGIALVLVAVRGAWAWALVSQPCLADSAAALAGGAVRGPRWPRSRKTVAGSLAFAATSALAARAAGMPLSPALLLAGVGAVVEASAPHGSDNLLLPLAGLAVWRVLR